MLCSICMTAVHNLLEKYNIRPEQIGRLEVGTETIIDKSKAVKTVLMQLFSASGNTSIEGVDTTNACYGGTSALFNAVNWVESSSWDGRYALVVCGDIAVYAKGAARPTGGCGAVAMLIGPNAPVVFERGLRASHMEHAWDFYKPVAAHSEYPTVDGKLSIGCYLRALDTCYERYASKFKLLTGSEFDMSKFDLACFHTPFNKLVNKSFGRYLLGDVKRNPAKYAPALAQHASAIAPAIYDNEIVNAFTKATEKQFAKVVGPSTLASRRIGNMYTASVYGNLLTLLNLPSDELQAKRILVFSYGSGLAASLFSLRVVGSTDAIRRATQIQARLDARTKKSPAQFLEKMAQREAVHHAVEGTYTPSDSLDDLAPGTYYLTGIDAMHRRSYARK